MFLQRLLKKNNLDLKQYVTKFQSEINFLVDLDILWVKTLNSKLKKKIKMLIKLDSYFLFHLDLSN